MRPIQGPLGLTRSMDLRGLELLVVENNPLGDDGVASLAGMLSSKLKDLRFGCTGCGDKGMTAMATTLASMTNLTALACDGNPAIGVAGWSALTDALPKLCSLTKVDVSGANIDTPTLDALKAAVPEGCEVVQKDWIQIVD